MRKAQALAVLQEADLYGVTAEFFSLGRSNVEVVRAMLEAGIRVVQYREKTKGDRDRLEECRLLREMTRAAEAVFIVNDRPDLALLVGADGVHLGQDDLSVTDVRRLLGPEKVIGLSTHSTMQAREAVALGADYIGVGPIYATQTKADVCDPVGLEYLDHVVAHIPLPFAAIGGIKAENIAEVRRRGARCIALVTEIVGAEDISAEIASLRRRLKAVV